jgi:hypothetical protein
MKFSEAKEKLKKIANGKYHSLKYEYGLHSNNKESVECMLYIHPNVMVGSDNWKNAFEKLNKILKPKDVIVDPIEQPDE